MKIVQINQSDLQGRRFNGYDLQLELNARGIPTKQFVLRKTSNNPNVIEIPGDGIRTAINNYVNMFEYNNSIRSLLSPFGWAVMKHPEFIKSSLVHAHLIYNSLFSFACYPTLSQLKPTVMTIHDPYVWTGRCIYPFECEKWKEGCHNCSSLGGLYPLQEDNSHYLWQLKKTAFSQCELDLVVATDWMMQFAINSPITSHLKNVHLIPFGINTDVFHARRDKQGARRKLGIRLNSFVILFRDSYFPLKGLDLINSMLKTLKVDTHITLLTVGEKGSVKKNSYKLVERGWIYDEEEMADVYAAADLFLMPSRGEAFGLMAIEAMASGIPVVIMEGTALTSVTNAPACGVLCRDQNEFNASVKRLINSPEERQTRGELGRKLAETNYRVEDHFRRIFELYEDVLKRRKRRE